MDGVAYQQYYTSKLKRYKEELDQKIREEIESGKPDITRLTQLKQAKYITPIFNDVFGTNERFRNPW